MNYECMGYEIDWSDPRPLLVREPDNDNPEWEYVENPGRLDEKGYRIFLQDHVEEREEIEAWKRRRSGDVEANEDAEEEKATR